jgi:flagellar hook assembly protein FlgD
VPNPFNPATTIRYRLPRQSRVTLKIYNISGQEIVTLVDSKSAPGTYRARWNGMNARNQVVPSGTYFALIRAGNFKKVISMTLLK